MFSAKPTADHYAMAAGIVGTAVFLLALILTSALPEPETGNRFHALKNLRHTC